MLECPSCNQPARKLIAGVCQTCKDNFKSAHKNKLHVEWKPEDFIIHETKMIQQVEPVVMDEEDESKEKLATAKDFFKRAAILLRGYKGNKTLALYAYCFACEWYDVIECETAVEIAVKLFKNPRKKAAVTKAILFFQDGLGIEPGRGQRSDEGRKEMGKARKKQLKK